MVLCGLDGCRHNAWVVAESDPDFRSVTFRVETDLKPLFLLCANGQAVAVLDVPIGLSHAPRACDAAARKLLKHRHVSVFTPPCRETLAARTYEEAVEVNRLHRGGAAISLQAFSIRERIKVVDELVTPELQERIKEGHPEVVFAVLNGGHPLKHAKDTAEGIAERLAFLAAAGLPSFDPQVERARLGSGNVALDDIVDSASMLLTARHTATGTASRLPAGSDERDERGLLMQMWTPPSRTSESTASKSGVLVHDDFRDNLIIDCYHPDLAAMRGSKRDRLRSENSEDALTWNVFRSLAQVDPRFWLPLLHRQAFPGATAPSPPQIVTLKVWTPVEPPPALRLHQKDEGPSEIDVVIETQFSVWFIEAKYKSDIITGTTNNATRDQIVRNLDVGSWYAGVRDFFFALLVMDEARSPKGVEAVRVCAATLPMLSHRPDGMVNIKGIGLLRWAGLADILASCERDAPRQQERAYAARAVAWLQERELASGAAGL
jgi:predicted RNase H-like nuclease